jgi:hypothetical protein
MVNQPSQVKPVGPLHHYPRRLLIALFTVLASLPMAALLSFFGSQVVLQAMPVSGDVRAISVVVIFFIAAWALFMFLFTLAGRLMPFLVVLSIPACYAMIGFQVSGSEWLFIAGIVVAFILLAKLINPTATAALAICTVVLAYGLYLVPALQPLFTSSSTTTVAWLMALLVCWTLLSVGFGLVENAIARPTAKEETAPEYALDPVKGQLRWRGSRIKHMTGAVSRLSSPEK